MQVPVAGLRIIYLQEYTVVRPAEPYVEFSTRCVENLREGLVELRESAPYSALLSPLRISSLIRFPRSQLR